MTKQDRLNIYLDPQICMDIKIYAVKTKQSVSKVAEQAIKEFLEKHQK
jgi:predicted transcriptional regulator